MLTNFNKLKKKIFSPETPLEKRIAYSMVFFAIVGSLFGFIESLCLKLSCEAILLPLLAFILLTAIYIWGIKTKHTKLFSLLAISIIGVIIFPLMFFANDGLAGGMPYYFLISFVCTALSLRGKTRIFVFFFFLIEYAGLCIFYGLYPSAFLAMNNEVAFIDQTCSLVISALIIFFFTYTVSKQTSHDRKIIKELSVLYEKQANTDELTGLYNRRYFNNFLKLAILTLGDTGKLHIAMFDIDDFKSVNDKYGHPFGDTVLKQFANILTESEKDGATACRYGGEEFLILISKKDREEALNLVEDILEKTRSSINLPDNKFITVSAGLLTCTDNISFEDALNLVDKNLYIAKANGKDRVFC